jgi:hypothetical protein
MILCNYCSNQAILADSAEVYNGRSYGPIWVCHPCQAWVGCHKGTDKPLGRLANAMLRRLKMRAHSAFDRYWKNTKTTSRKQAYAALATVLGVSLDDCHIGMFDEDMCKRVIAVCASGELAIALR